MRLAQVHEERQQADGRDRGNADAREHQRAQHLRLPLLDDDGAAVDEGLGVLADGLHVLHAHIGVQDELPGILIALAAQLEAQLHFGELARDLARQQGQLLHVVGRVEELVAQVVEVLLHAGQRLVVGFQVAVVAGEQVAALAGLGIQHALQQAVQGPVRHLAVGHLGDGLLGAHVTDLVDPHQHHGREQRHGQAQGHLSDFGKQVLGDLMQIHMRYSG